MISNSSIGLDNYSALFDAIQQTKTATTSTKKTEAVAKTEATTKTNAVQYKYNTPKEKPLTIGQKLIQQREVATAQKQAQDTVTVLQKANGALDETSANLHRMKELATEALNGKNVDTAALQKELDSRKDNITKIGDSTNYNSHKLVDGSLELVISTNKETGKDESIAIGDMRAKALGVADLNITDQKSAKESLAKIEEALQKVSKQRDAISVAENKKADEIKNLQENPSSIEQYKSKTTPKTTNKSTAKNNEAESIKQSMEQTRKQLTEQWSLISSLHSVNRPGVLHLLR